LKKRKKFLRLNRDKRKTKIEFNFSIYWVGEVGFELMESTTPDGDVAKFIEKRGEGVMVISFNVDNTREAMGELQQKRLSLYWGSPTVPGL
jgi:4-hydroxyphenylpyruvate dioxygenase-like putative hemolysin